MNSCFVSRKQNIIQMGGFVFSLVLLETEIYLLSLPWHMLVWMPIILSIPLLNSSFRSKYLSFNFRVIQPLLIGILCMIGAMELANHKEWFEKLGWLAWLDKSYTHNENFFAVLSTLYAVFTALILVKVIEDHEHLKQSIQNESSKIRTILQFLKYFEDFESKSINREKVNEIKKQFASYLQNITKTNGMGFEGNLSLLEGCVKTVSELKTQDKNDEIALAQIMSSLDEVFMLRAKRISYMNTSISPYLLFAIIFMSITILIPFYLTSEGNVERNIYIILVLGISFSFLFNMILDIGSPHFGAWQVSLEPFEEVLAMVKNDAGLLPQPPAGLETGAVGLRDDRGPART